MDASVAVRIFARVAAAHRKFNKDYGGMVAGDKMYK
jgi:hypothetical protein